MLLDLKIFWYLDWNRDKNTEFSQHKHTSASLKCFSYSFLKAVVSPVRKGLQKHVTPGKASTLWSGLVFLKCREALMRCADARAAQETVYQHLAVKHDLFPLLEQDFLFIGWNSSRTEVKCRDYLNVEVVLLYDVMPLSSLLRLWDVFLPNVCSGLIKQREDRTECRMSCGNLFTSIWVSFLSGRIRIVSSEELRWFMRKDESTITQLIKTSYE